MLGLDSTSFVSELDALNGLDHVQHHEPKTFARHLDTTRFWSNLDVVELVPLHAKDPSKMGRSYTKDHYEKAKQSYEAYVNEIRSDQRDEAAACSDKNKYLESSF